MEWVFGQLLAQSRPNDLLFAIDRIARVPISTIVVFAGVLTLVRLALFPYIRKTPIHKRTGVYSFARVVNDISDAVLYAAIVVFLLVRPFGIQTFFIPSPSMVDTLRVGDFIVANKWVYRTSDPQFGDIVVFKPPKEAITPDMGEQDFIKRCIGVPGDVIEIRDWQLYRNGQPITENYKVISDRNSMYLSPLPQSEWESNKDSMPNFKLVEYGEPKSPLYPQKDGKAIIPLMYQSQFGGGISVNAWEPSFPVEINDWETAAQLPPVAIPPGYFLMIGDNRNGSKDSRFWGLVPRANIVGKAEVVWLPIKRAKRLTNPHADAKPSQP